MANWEKYALIVSHTVPFENYRRGASTGRHPRCRGQGRRHLPVGAWLSTAIASAMLAAWTSSRSGKTAVPNFVGGRQPPPTMGRKSRCSVAAAAHPGAPAWCLCTASRRRASTTSPWRGELSSEFDIYLLDFPGYGLSDKPPEPYVYSLYDDARLLVYAITQVWKLTEYRMLTHDRGSSVGMIALGDAGGPGSAGLTRRPHLDERQHLPSTVEPHRVPNRTARPRNRAGHRGSDDAGDPGGRHGGQHLHADGEHWTDPEIAALAKCFAHNDGIRVLPDTIQYLNERAADETSWLEALSKQPREHHGGVGAARQRRAAARPQPRLADLSEEQARPKPLLGGARTPITTCNATRPVQLAQIVRLTAQGEDITLQTLGNQPDGAVLVDQSTDEPQ